MNINAEGEELFYLLENFTQYIAKQFFNKEDNKKILSSFLELKANTLSQLPKNINLQYTKGDQVCQFLPTISAGISPSLLFFCSRGPEKTVSTIYALIGIGYLILLISEKNLAKLKTSHKFDQFSNIIQEILVLFDESTSYLNNETISEIMQKYLDTQATNQKIELFFKALYFDVMNDLKTDTDTAAMTLNHFLLLSESIKKILNWNTLSIPNTQVCNYLKNEACKHSITLLVISKPSSIQVEEILLIVNSTPNIGLIQETSDFRAKHTHTKSVPGLPGLPLPFSSIDGEGSLHTSYTRGKSPVEIKKGVVYSSGTKSNLPPLRKAFSKENNIAPGPDQQQNDEIQINKRVIVPKEFGISKDHNEHKIVNFFFD